MKQLGLLIRLIIGIIAGTIIGLSGGWLGIADSTGFIAVIRAFATFTSLFSTFLTFMIPLIILAFVSVGMAELGQKANRLFLLTLGLAYGTTVLSGFVTFFIGKAALPSLIQPITGDVLESNAFEAFFTIEVDPIFGVMTALVLSFVLGIGMANLRTGRHAQRVPRAAEDRLHRAGTHHHPADPGAHCGLFAAIAAEAACSPRSRCSPRCSSSFWCCSCCISCRSSRWPVWCAGRTT